MTPDDVRDAARIAWETLASAYPDNAPAIAREVLRMALDSLPPDDAAVYCGQCKELRPVCHICRVTRDVRWCEDHCGCRKKPVIDGGQIVGMIRS